MNISTQREKYEAPRLEVQRLRELPPALAISGSHCHATPSHGSVSCSTSGGGK